jgi:hypothetical protein
MGHLGTRGQMFRLAFALLWTLGVLVLAVATGDQLQGWELAVLYAFAAFGAVFSWLSWLYVRRRRSLRTVTEAGVTVYVWIDLNGREGRSCEDPRPGWDDADGDGDGDGGD